VGTWEGGQLACLGPVHHPKAKARAMARPALAAVIVKMITQSLAVRPLLSSADWMVSHLYRPARCGPSPKSIRLTVRTSHHEDLELLRPAPCWRRGPPLL